MATSQKNANIKSNIPSVRIRSLVNNFITRVVSTFKKPPEEDTKPAYFHCEEYERQKAAKIARDRINRVKNNTIIRQF